MTVKNQRELLNLLAQ